jgi:hypothetical protein
MHDLIKHAHTFLRKQTSHKTDRQGGFYESGGLVTSSLKDYGYKPYFQANVAMYGYAVGSPDLPSQQMEVPEEKGHRRSTKDVNSLDFSTYCRK